MGLVDLGETYHAAGNPGAADAARTLALIIIGELGLPTRTHYARRSSITSTRIGPPSH